MAHEHPLERHQHHHAVANYNKAFAIGVGLNLAFVVIEAICGYLAESLVLLADAGHNLSDVLSLLLAWGASALAERKPSARRTYGYRRVTVLASLFSGVLLVLALGAIAWEAMQRLVNPAPVDGWIVIIVAGIGVVINSATALLFVSGQKVDLNIKGAYLHLAVDAAVSLGVVVTGVLIMVTGLAWIDPVVTLLIVAIILIGTWGLLRDSMNLAVDAVPSNIDSVAVRTYLSGLPGVDNVHDLHIWGFSTRHVALTVHLIMPELPDSDGFLHDLAQALNDRFGIGHSTVQIERGVGDSACTLVEPNLCD
jgi:cobalt-zinc-cadmium efflux system protein